MSPKTCGQLHGGGKPWAACGQHGTREGGNPNLSTSPSSLTKDMAGSFMEDSSDDEVVPFVELVSVLGQTFLFVALVCPPLPKPHPQGLNHEKPSVKFRLWGLPPVIHLCL